MIGVSPVAAEIEEQYDTDSGGKRDPAAVQEGRDRLEWSGRTIVGNGIGYIGYWRCFGGLSKAVALALSVCNGTCEVVVAGY